MKSRNKNKELAETKEENNLWSVPGTSHGDNSTTFFTAVDPKIEIVEHSIFMTEIKQEEPESNDVEDPNCVQKEKEEHLVTFEIPPPFNRMSSTIRVKSELIEDNEMPDDSLDIVEHGESSLSKMSSTIHVKSELLEDNEMPDDSLDIVEHGESSLSRKTNTIPVKTEPLEDNCKLDDSRNQQHLNPTSNPANNKTLEEQNVKYEPENLPYLSDDCDISLIPPRIHTDRRTQRTHHVTYPCYTCDRCGKTFKLKKDLKYHLMANLGMEPYTCAAYNAYFYPSGNLKKHERTHTGRKPDTCAECNASFAKSNSLKKHMKTHTGEKPYTCTDCNACFAQSSTLKKHMKTHTGEKLIQV